MMASSRDSGPPASRPGIRPQATPTTTQSPGGGLESDGSDRAKEPETDFDFEKELLRSFEREGFTDQQRRDDVSQSSGSSVGPVRDAPPTTTQSPGGGLESESSDRAKEPETDFDFEKELLRSFEREGFTDQQRRDEVSQSSGSSVGPLRNGSRLGRRSRSQAGERDPGPEAINRPFERIGELVVRQQGQPGWRSESEVAGSAPQGEVQRPSETVRKVSRQAEDEELFLKAMVGVEPMSGRNEVVARRRPVIRRGVGEEAEALARLSDLVTGSVAFDVSDTVEYVEGIAKGLDRRLLSRLRRGHYSVQAHLDLHGMTREEAKEAVFEFFLEARRRSLRCLLVITGRGRHSQGKEPVLKAAFTEWLIGKRLGRHVLAFCSARPHDGGTGAFYVLLRR